MKLWDGRPHNVIRRQKTQRRVYKAVTQRRRVEPGSRKKKRVRAKRDGWVGEKMEGRIQLVVRTSVCLCTPASLHGGWKARAQAGAELRRIRSGASENRARSNSRTERAKGCEGTRRRASGKEEGVWRRGGPGGRQEGQSTLVAGESGGARAREHLLPSASPHGGLSWYTLPPSVRHLAGTRRVRDGYKRCRARTRPRDPPSVSHMRAGVEGVAENEEWE